METGRVGVGVGGQECSNFLNDKGLGFLQAPVVGSLAWNRHCQEWIPKITCGERTTGQRDAASMGWPVF